MTTLKTALPDYIMPFDQVRVGMKGYGLSVFHGVKIETFDVIVISVMQNFRPNGKAIWIRCTDARMQKSGAVQGMSGSPIYLWQDGQQHTAGKGGKLIGAFAFGFPLAKDCYVGIQPIEHMLKVGSRVEYAMKQAKQENQQPNLNTEDTKNLINIVLQQAARRGLGDQYTYQAKFIAKLFDQPDQLNTAFSNNQMPLGQTPFNQTNVDQIPLPQLPPDQLSRGSQQAHPLMLPINVGSTEVAELLTPLYAPLGLSPVASGNGVISGKAPSWIDLSKIKLEPGSVLAIPLAWGASDLSASGTVTDVLPDGRVLGFGHAMFGQGPTALPMATGFVHLVLPSIRISFKLGGSGQIKGAIVEDENTGVAGSPKGVFKTSKASYRVHMPGHPTRQFDYTIVQHKSLTPRLAITTAIQSLTSFQKIPAKSTLLMKAKLNFAKGKQLQFNSILTSGSAMEVVMKLLPPMAAMIQNPFESLMLENLDIDFNIIPKRMIGSVIEAHLDKEEIEPGETLGIDLKIQPIGEPSFYKHLKFKVPKDLGEGIYPLIVCGPRLYFSLYLASHPHLRAVTNVDELYALLKRITSVPDNALFVLLKSKKKGIAFGQMELPQMPSSRQALFVTPTRTGVKPYQDWFESSYPTDLVINTNVRFNIHVRKKKSQ